jgi:hypothetical protein
MPRVLTRGNLLHLRLCVRNMVAFLQSIKLIRIHVEHSIDSRRVIQVPDCTSKTYVVLHKLPI